MHIYSISILKKSWKVNHHLFKGSKPTFVNIGNKSIIHVYLYLNLIPLTVPRSQRPWVTCYLKRYFMQIIAALRQCSAAGSFKLLLYWHFIFQVISPIYCFSLISQLTHSDQGVILLLFCNIYNFAWKLPLLQMNLFKMWPFTLFVICSLLFGVWKVSIYYKQFVKLLDSEIKSAEYCIFWKECLHVQ